MSTANSTKNRERLTFTTAPTPGPLPNCCEYAESFLAVCEPMVEAVRRSPTEVSVNVALLQLQSQYFMRFEMAPKAHKDHIGGRKHHNCLFQVYRHYFFQLHDLLLTVNPPPLRTPVAPARPQANGIFIGEDLGQP